jgi:hypothetical protein
VLPEHDCCFSRPPYSPALIPIEQVFAKLKHLMRNITWPKSWNEKRLDVSREAGSIDRTVEDAWRINTIAA